MLSEKVKEFLQEKKVQSFYQQELEMVESLKSLASQAAAHNTDSDQVSATHWGCRGGAGGGGRHE